MKAKSGGTAHKRNVSPAYYASALRASKLGGEATKRKKFIFQRAYVCVDRALRNEVYSVFGNATNAFRYALEAKKKER